jgi:hypothetical protein
MDALRTREVLLSILTSANIEKDICEDVADACELSNLDALAIASGLMAIAEVAEQCFLTTDEADVRSMLCIASGMRAGTQVCEVLRTRANV